MPEASALRFKFSQSFADLRQRLDGQPQAGASMGEATHKVARGAIPHSR
jgi:hypothetical protein